jgi:hypothetical protein
MKRLSAALVVLFIAGSAFAKEKPRVTIQVVDAETSERETSYTVAGKPSVSKTTCNASENQTVYGKSNGKTVRAAVDKNSSSACTTVSDPGAPPTTQVRSIRQENVEAIMADGTHVTLWCQQGVRKCLSLPVGHYSAEVDGNTVWIYVRELSGKENKVKYKAVSVAPSAAPSGDEGAA